MKGTALVTGGARRIGRAIARALAREGYDISLHYNSSEREAKEVAREIEHTGRRCRLFPCNFTNMAEVFRLIPAVFDAFPDCTLLINNASVFERGRLMDTSEELFDRQFTINFKVPFFLTREFARHCKRGHIINIIDAKAARSHIEYFAYTLSKKALYEFTRMSAKELAPNIRVNGVAPGLILPPPEKDDAYLERLSKHIPLQRRGDPQSVVKAILFLIRNDYITGECIFVDGGEHLIN
ncbi:SDR family oxidoreductase [Candidatus Sumerlaeota bacterium]|nr:SDR family oxidoreductase [Candidatus Sumerlaeota bacterium]